MTSAVARVDFQWFSFLLRNSHCTSPSRLASAGCSSMSVRSAKAWVSIVSLYQSQERSSCAQKVPWSWRGLRRIHHAGKHERRRPRAVPFSSASARAGISDRASAASSG